MSNIHQETICALATATGGALSVIRISGADSLAIVSKLFSKDISKAKGNTIHYGTITDPQLHSEGTEDAIDEVLLSVFRAPHSYTGEDSVEISCHGSAYIAKKILELLVKNGCRMAEPGEFTMRAYMNGKMDLSQAEAVADLIASANAASHKLAMSQLRGHLSTKLSELREQLLHLTTLLELELDFSDHEDLEFADRTELLSLANTIENHIGKLADSFEKGQALKNGINVAIIGRTNVGKSTLLNKLLKDDKAIVSDIHGTTRDTIEDVIDIGGVAFRFIDTAGLRATEDEIERIGIERTYKSISKAKIVIWITDCAPTEDERNEILSLTHDKNLIEVRNKADILEDSIGKHNDTIFISAKYGQGIDILEHALLSVADVSMLHENDVIVTSARHYSALCSAQENLHRVITGLGGNGHQPPTINHQPSTINPQLPSDLVAEDLRMVLNDLAEITGGTITSQETLNNVFSHFCVGK